MSKAVEGVERRIISVLFCDLVDFTPLSEKFDAEDVATIQQAYFASAHETVVRYQGRIEKFIGDAVMAVFGLPLARDDDAERAVRAALAITRGIDRVASDLDLDEGVLRIRAGVNTGEVVVRAETYSLETLVTGDVVNVAARLQAAAPTGGVLVGEETALAVAGSVELSAVAPLDLKGKSEPVRAFEALGPRATPSRDYAMGKLRSPMMGRAQELSELLSLWERARAGDVVSVTMLAPPGTGKSRLTAELADRLDGPVFAARCGLHDASPFDPIADLLLAALGEHAADADAIETALRRAGSGYSEPRLRVIASEVSSLVLGVSQSEPAGGADLRALRFDAWSSALQALPGGPSAWIIEDLHRAGDDLLAFVDHVLDVRRGPGLLVVGTARSSYLGRPGAVDTEQVMHLASLQPTTAEALVQALVGDALPEPIVTAIAERSDGNPLFIEELLRTWVGLGVLAHDEETWRLTVVPKEIVLPSTVHALYAAQLDDLPAPARDVARKGSVSGRRFPGSALEDLEVFDASNGLDVLTRRAIVSGPEPAGIVGDTYTYRHGLLREAGYVSLGRAERARLHLRLARWIERAAGTTVEDVAELVANHHAWALESGTALGGRIEGIDREELQVLTATWLERAADGAAKGSALSSAASLYRRALDITPSDFVLDQVRRSALLGAALAATRGKDEALEHLRHAWEMARQLDLHLEEHRATFAQAATALGEAEFEQLGFDAARRLSAEALERLGEDGDDPATARLHLLHARAEYGLTNDPSPLKRVTDQVLHTARAHNDRELEMRALALHAHSHGAWERIEQLARDLGDPGAVCSALTSQAAYLMLDQPAQARETLERAEEIADAYGMTEALGWIDYHRLENHFALGDWDAAVEAGMRALETAERFAYHRIAFRTWCALLPIVGTTGRVDIVQRAGEWFDRQRDTFPDPPSPYALVMVNAAEWWIATTLGEPSKLPDDRAIVEAIAELTHGMPSYVTAVETTARGYMQRGLLGPARAITEAWKVEPELYGASTIGPGVKSLLQAELLLLDGSDIEAVEANAREAERSLRLFGALWWLSKALRLLERAERATPAEIDEARRIEQVLGIPSADRSR